MWQNLIVAVIVAAALLHFSTKYLPAAWRRQIVYLLARHGVNQDKAARFFKTTPDCGSGCGSCGSCGTDAKAPAAGAAGAAGASRADASQPLKRVIPLHVQR
ncbi:DUF6587 family protein [Duganella phyllosphaerae]|uniref:Uncharacterized protein n=1 Tax=Duganella phyllosphaerae TaxID=762836 RepID=A0A1E7WJL1_9BURK|nr:DUF6587 family protein [Duganella phyllosphaerae]OEZ98840.1 hypothetical protein DUPY_30220 [Duganella phyllosphaerae]